MNLDLTVPDSRPFMVRDLILWQTIEQIVTKSSSTSIILDLCRGTFWQIALHTLHTMWE